MTQAARHRTIWLSDIHLGSRACRVDLLLDFLPAALLVAGAGGQDAHRPCRQIRRTLRDGLIYCDDGDWVESCTALVESHAGELSLLHWGQSAAAPAVATEALPLRDAA